LGDEERRMTRGKDSSAVGTTWTQKVLGSTATYRVVEDLGDIVVVSVMDAPGLETGTELRLQRDALRGMEQVGASSRSSARGSRPSPVPRLRPSRQ
jgi:hypothetical protein